MSCNGCRVLRRGCSESCVLRPCLEWIDSPQAQANATLFVSKFFGRSDLMSFIAAVPATKRPALFQSLLFEACGRTVNPVNGAIGLLSTGNWHICQSAVQTVLSGGTLRPVSAVALIDESSGAFRSDFFTLPEQRSSHYNDTVFFQPSDREISFAGATGRGFGGINIPTKKSSTGSSDSEESEMMLSFGPGDYGMEKLRSEEPKLLKLFE